MKHHRIPASVGLFILGSALLTLASTARALVWEDFEGPDSAWSTNKFGGSLLNEGQISTDFASSGRASYRGHFVFPAKGGRAAFTTTQGADMTGLKAFVFDLYNSSPLAFEGFLVYKSGNDWKWHESTRFKLQSGWNKDVTVTVDGNGTANIQGEALDNVREVDIVLDAKEGGEGYLYLDHIRLDGPDGAKYEQAKAQGVVTGEEVLLAGFEGLGSPFGADTWSGSSATGVENIKTKTTEGTHAGRFTFDSHVPDDKPSFTLEADLDLTGVAGIRYDVYNPLPDDVDCAIAISTGEWVYHESVMKTLKPGWNLNVTFPIRSSNYKSAASNWANTSSVANLAHTRKISLLFMPHVVGKGFFLVDDVRIVADHAKAFAALLSAAGVAEVPVPQGTDRLLDGFEGEPRWFADSSSSAAVSAVVVEASTTQGKKMLEGSFDLAGSRKNAFFAVEAKLDLTGAQAVKVDIYNPGTAPLQAEMALSIGDQYAWFESRLVDLKPGWNLDVTFPLNSPTFKCAATQWRNKALPGPLSKIRKLSLGVYSNNPLNGKVYLDNVRVTFADGFGGGSTHPYEAPALSAQKVFSQRSEKAGPTVAAVAPGEGMLDALGKGHAPVVVKGREVIFDPLMTASGGWQADQLAADDSFGVAVLYGRRDGTYGVNLKYRTATEQQKGMFYKDGQFDWTSVTGLRFDVYNPQDHPVEVSVALKTGGAYAWHESQRFNLKPGWNHDVTVPVDAPIWKTVQSNWANTDNVSDVNDVRSVILIVYPNHGEEGQVFLSHLRTVERDFLGTTTGQESLGKLLGVSDQISVRGTAVKSRRVMGFDDGTAGPPLSLSSTYNTQGSKALKIPYINYSNNVGDITVKLPSAYQDLSSYQALMFDFYNAGPPQALTVGFKRSDANGTWFSSTAAITLATGWNRDLTVPLTGPTFKSAATAWKSGATLGIANQVNEIHFQISGPAGRNTVTLDNLRVVGGSLETRGAVSATEDLQLKFNPCEAVQLLVGGSAWKNHDASAGGDLEKVQLDVRGLNQEFRASVGSALTSTDDPFKLLDASVVGSSVFGLSERATVHNTSLNLYGFSRSGDRPLELGSGGAWGARLSQTLFDNYQVGAGILDHRTGNEPGSNPFTAEVESSIQTAQADVKGYIPKASLTFEGEVARSYYDEYQGASYGVPSSVNQNSAYHFLVTWSHGAWKLAGGRDDKGTGFFSPYSTQNSHGFYQNHGEVDFQLDTLKPLKTLRQKGGFIGDLVENLKFYTQYYDWHDRTSTYNNFGIRSVLETNDYKTPLYLRAWWYWYNEGKDSGDTTLDDPSRSTHLLEFTQNFEARYRLRPNFYLNALGRLDSTKYWEAATGDGGVKIRFWGDTSLTGDVKFVKMAGSRCGSFTNLNAGIDKRIRTRLMMYEVSLTYGTPSFLGYWMDDANLKTTPMWNLTLTGRF